jgi:hypothetical protein
MHTCVQTGDPWIRISQKMMWVYLWVWLHMWHLGIYVPRAIYGCTPAGGLCSNYYRKMSWGWPAGEYFRIYISPFQVRVCVWKYLCLYTCVWCALSHVQFRNDASPHTALIKTVRNLVMRWEILWCTIQKHHSLHLRSHLTSLDTWVWCIHANSFRDLPRVLHQFSGEPVLWRTSSLANQFSGEPVLWRTSSLANLYSPGFDSACGSFPNKTYVVLIQLVVGMW